jgi:hypothetical protein
VAERPCNQLFHPQNYFIPKIIHAVSPQGDGREKIRYRSRASCLRLPCHSAGLQEQPPNRNHAAERCDRLVVALMLAVVVIVMSPTMIVVTPMVVIVVLAVPMSFVPFPAFAIVVVVRMGPVGPLKWRTLPMSTNPLVAVTHRRPISFDPYQARARRRSWLCVSDRRCDSPLVNPRGLLSSTPYAPAVESSSTGRGASAIRVTPITTRTATPISNSRSPGFWNAWIVITVA